MTRTRIFAILILTLFTVSPALTERDRVQSGGGRGRPPVPVISTAAIPQESPLASLLEAVPDIKVETIAGQVPRLPSAIPAVYRNKAKGPDVRVIWPSPKDNGQFLKPGTTTVTGKGARHAIPTQGHGDRERGFEDGARSDASRRGVPPRPGRFGPGHQGA